MLSRFHLIPERYGPTDRQTDRQIDGQICYVSMLTRDLLAIAKFLLRLRLQFDAEYLTNGCRYGHNYYRRRRGNRTQAFELHQLQ